MMLNGLVVPFRVGGAARGEDAHGFGVGNLCAAWDGEVGVGDFREDEAGEKGQ